MSEQKPPGAASAPPEEPFLERWSRRKANVKAGVEVDADAPVRDVAAQDPVPEEPAQAPVAVELPDLDTLSEDSDYSAFMSPGVDADLRRKALRKLFSSPKFNVCDGLDDYCDDYTTFESLGDIVTADMKYHIERVARAAAKALEEAGQRDEVTALAAAPAAASDAAGAPPSKDQKEDHDGPEPPA
jgi:hypothetical protein